MQEEKGRYHVMVIVGARPNFVKAAPLLTELKKEVRFKATLVHTGQHYDREMSGSLLDELALPTPDVSLGVGSSTHAVQTAKIMMKFEEVCLDHKPDCIVVVGDVNSTMACTLVAVKLGIRVVHVEAGLRSFDRSMPEEINRIVTDALADVLFTHSAEASENLREEGVSESRIKFVGNIMIDSLVSNLHRVKNNRVITQLGLRKKAFVYVTLHRPCNVDEKERLNRIVEFLREISLCIPIVFPAHPRTNKMLSQFRIAIYPQDRFHLIGPVGYVDSINLAKQARLVITDSGGLQEETTFFKTPCLTLRPNTERPVTITVGSNKLTNLKEFRSDVNEALNEPFKKGRVPELWDGKTAKRIIRYFCCEMDWR